MWRKGYGDWGGVNILKGRVRAEGVERSHVAAENIGEQWRMLGMKFYITNKLDYILHCNQTGGCESHKGGCLLGNGMGMENPGVN